MTWTRENADGPMRRNTCHRRPGVAFACLFLLTRLAAVADTEIPVPAELEKSAARIGNISIVNENIFDLDNPQENRLLYRWANALHIKTRANVIENQLLFHSGDTYSVQRVEETERLLRSNRYLRDAEVSATDYHDGVVDLDVRTSDVWTLNPGISFSRGGGKNSGGIALKEHNLLGGGASIGIGYKSNVDRDTTTLRYFNRNMFGSRYQLLTDYSNASDGFTKYFGLDTPFYAMDTRHAGGIALGSGKSVESLYDRGDIVSQFEHVFRHYEVYVGKSAGLHAGWTRRYIAGLAYDAHEFSPPADSEYPTADTTGNREFTYPFVGVELLQDDFVATRNLDQINRVEDRFLGRRLAFRLGYADTGLGSSSDAFIFSGQYNDALYRTAASTLLLSADVDGRVENGMSRNLKLSLATRYDLRQSDKLLFHVDVSGTLGKNPDIDNPTYLGGDNGLRGYPLRYQSGDKSMLFTVEQRLFTDWYPFRLFNIGAAAFFDAGRTWGPSPSGGENLGWLRDFGVGLRIGNTRSGLGRMIHVDLAYPLDGESDISHVQLLVEARQGF